MIRLATHEDVDQIAELDLLLFQEFSINEGTLRREFDVDTCWVIGDPIIAYALVRVQPDLSDLLRLGVHTEHQGKGLGSMLLKHVIENVPGELMLTVLRTNVGAQRLYRGHGFHLSALLDDNAFLMRRPARKKKAAG